MGFRLNFKWLSFEGIDMAIDLGTTNTLIYTLKDGIVLDEDSMIALREDTGDFVAVGKDVKKMLGRTPDNVRIVRPMEDGVIADFKAVEKMLRCFIQKVQKKKLFIKPRVIVAVPSGITPVEKRAIINSIEESGAREVYLIFEPIAAAVGIGLPVTDPSGNIIIDIGGGTTEIAVIAMSGIVNKVSIKIAGNELDDAIQIYLYDRYNLAVGQVTAENIKETIGSASLSDKIEEMEIRGRDMVTGLPTTVKVNSEEIREAMKEPLGLMNNAIKKTLSETPPELASDIVDKGLILTGGGSLLSGIDKMISESTNLYVKISDDPLENVVKGAGIILGDIGGYRELLVNPD
ncbi:rod shape-determining protein [candidate division WOR-3 bacterium]|nr:rod shape-determining protein [candidate division WOR-3 bacterium]